MLAELSIQNFAIIDALEISFHPGLNVLSGETGAGKSIIVGALSLLLGDRASAEMIRTAADAAVVEAVFQVRNNGELLKRMAGMGLDPAEELVIRRSVSRGGKNRIHVNGHPVSLSMLAALGECLVDICSQHEHQVLLNPDRHLDLLDAYAGLAEEREAFGLLYDEYQGVLARLREIEGVRRRRLEREEWLRFSIREIREAGLSSGEEAALKNERQVLGNVRKLQELAGRAHESLHGRDGAVLDVLRGIMADVREIRRIDGAFDLSEANLDSFYYGLEEAAATLRVYRDGLTVDPGRMEAVEERLELLRRLKRKYDGDEAAILGRADEMEQELLAISRVEEDAERLAHEETRLRGALEERAQMLSERRRQGAPGLQQSLEEEIRSLRMDPAQFEILFRPAGNGEAPAVGPRGWDDVEFLLSTNVGEEPKPLHRIASGGELSRIILAMKKVLVRGGSVGTIVFDEVDSGIGGATAEVVGERIREVSGRHQVVCITHLPQIACFAQRHFRVSKALAEERTASRVEVLTEAERLEEVARMLGGVRITEKTRAHAREMLGRAAGGTS
ncbi:MAG: DNA repair protein RecN [Syntrophaceae bacterium]|nr:DNA repair protein RecN [Syntrophaceae bacterium]